MRRVRRGHVGSGTQNVCGDDVCEGVVAFGERVVVIGDGGVLLGTASQVVPRGKSGARVRRNDGLMMSDE